MDKKTEALKLALEALKQIDEAMPFPVAKFAQSAIREALAEQSAHESAYQRGYMDGIAKGLRMEQPAQQQEPVAWMTEEATNGVNVWLFKKTALKYSNNPTPLYTSPPNVPTARASKPWGRLTYDDLDDIAVAAKKGNLYDLRLAIEAKLREKNQ